MENLILRTYAQILCLLIHNWFILLIILQSSNLPKYHGYQMHDLSKYTVPISFLGTAVWQPFPQSLWECCSNIIFNFCIGWGNGCSHKDFGNTEVTPNHNLGVWWTYYLSTILCRFMSLGTLSKNFLSTILLLCPPPHSRNI